MKMNSTTITWLILSFIWSIFMGVTAGAIGVGALFPPINLIAKPFICPNGQMLFNQETSNPLPGTTYTQTSWVCQDNQSGQQQELGIFPMTFYSGAFIGLLIFVVVVIIWYLAARNSAAPAPPAPASQWESHQYEKRNFNGSQAGNASARMRELKELLDSNSITEEEYQKKRAEILREL